LNMAATDSPWITIPKIGCKHERRVRSDCPNCRVNCSIKFLIDF
jgi:hypothetical protein